MIPINNSDLSWLIVTDYNQDNNLPYLDLLEDIINPNTNDWCYIDDSSHQNVGGRISTGYFVGGYGHNPNAIIHITGHSVGTACISYNNHLVGANE
jgi:hypothetical protein